MAHELEVKLDVPGGAPLADGDVADVVDLDDLPGVARHEAPVRRTLDARYLDTPERSLLALGATLRRRTGDAGGARWTFKVPVSAPARHGALGRDEHDVDVDDDDDGDEPPPSLLRRLAAVTDVPGDALVPIARLVTDRRAVVLVDDAGRGLVEVADDRVRAEVGATVVAWREIEVEALTDDPTLVDHVVARLRLAGAVDADPRPKLARALDDAGSTT